MVYWNNYTIDKIRKGFYSAVYFNRTQHILLQEKNFKIVTMQIFQKQDAVLAGVELITELFKQAVGYFENGTWIGMWDDIKIESLHDGNTIAPWESVMHITGPYAYFAHLESLYLGILARATKIATHTKKVVTAANEKQVIFFADRFDYFLNQELDGYAAHIGGIDSICTDAHGFFWNDKPVGTIPHALIAVNNGNTVIAAEQFAKQYPNIPLITLVDFDNDCVKTSLEVAKRFGKKLFAVRLDTSETNIDNSLFSLSLQVDKKSPSRNAENKPYTSVQTKFRERNPSTPVGMTKVFNGVNQELVRNVRQALDQNGFQHVKIVVSGGFNAEKIKLFEKENVPVDIYGVGSSLMQGNIDFTADIVKVDGKEIAKEGRIYKENKRFEI